VDRLPAELCEVKVFTPAKTKTFTKEIEIIPERFEYVTYSPEFITESEQIVIQEAHKHGATFVDGSETLVVSKEYTQFESTPPKFEAETRYITLYEGGPKIEYQYQKLIKTAVLTQVNQPKMLKTFDKKYISKQGSGQSFPAVTKRFTRRVMSKPARFERVVVPKVSKTIEKDVEIAPAQENTYKAVCNLEQRKDIIFELKSKLTNNGIYSGNIDHVWSDDLELSIEEYQKSQKLAIVPNVTTELLQALQIDY